MSVIAAGELCGVCAARKSEPLTASPAAIYDPVEILRGEVLVAADRLHYPRIRVLSRIVASGIDEWLPLLREADEAQLQDTPGPRRHRVPTHKEVDDEHPALIH